MQPNLSYKVLQASLALVLALVGGNATAESRKDYALTVDNKEIGSIIVQSESLPGGGRRISQNLRIKTSGFWNSLDISGTLEETITAEGKLQETSSKYHENKKVYWSKLARSGDEYLSFRAQMKSDEEKDIEELAGLATGVVTVLVPGAGDIIEIGSLLLSDSRNTPKHDRLTAESFDTSLAGLPFHWQRNAYQLPEKLKIFDTEDMVIMAARVEDHGADQLAIGTARVPARHYRLTIRGSDPIDVWLLRESDGRAYFAQVTGKENGSAFQVTLRPDL